MVGLYCSKTVDLVVYYNSNLRHILPLPNLTVGHHCSTQAQCFPNHQLPCYGYDVLGLMDLLPSSKHHL